MSDTQPAAAPPSPAKFEEIILEEPIVRGETRIDRIQLRKPSAGELRGLNLQSLMQGDINSVLALVPRITIPPIAPHEAEKLELADLAAVAGAVNGFFMSKSDQALLAKVMGLATSETSTD